MNIPGFNTLWPTRQQYDDFLIKLQDSLKPFEKEGLTLLLFGSFMRGKGDFNAGLSDIDGVINFTDDIVTDKTRFMKVASAVNYALEGNDVPFQVNVTDSGTWRDGRFVSFNPSYKINFLEDGKIMVGMQPLEEFLEQFRFELPTMNDQSELSFNLRKARQKLLLSRYDLYDNPSMAVKNFTSTLKAVTSGAKKICHMSMGKLNPSRFSSLELLPQIFPDLDTFTLGYIRKVYNPEDLSRIYRNHAQMDSLWQESVTFLETLVKAYIEKFPRTDNI